MDSKKKQTRRQEVFWAALEPALSRGWRLLPCAERDKKALIRDWPRRASCDADMIRTWERKYERCNWAVATGPGSGVWVLDVDGESGRSSFCSLVERHGAWAKTLAVTTSRGQHLYFSYPVTTNIRNSTQKLGPGLDVRGENGYALIPPSVHPSGHPYEWAIPLNGVAPASAPDWLLEAVTSASRPIVQASEIGIVREGQRNDGLFRTACYLRRRGLTLAEIVYELLQQNVRRCRPPLSEAEIRNLAASACRYEIGGPDPLEIAWRAIQAETHNSRYEQFAALVCELQRRRPGQPVILPLERIGGLMECGWTSVRGYRTQAVLAGLIQRVADPVPHRRAAEYRVNLPSEASIATMGKNPLTPTNGLVAICGRSHGGKHNSRGGNSNSHGGNYSAEAVFYGS